MPADGLSRMFPGPQVDAIIPESNPVLTGLSWDALYNFQKAPA